eukprot:11531092-Alexandrium_andersonii.AAC.1
MGGRDLSSPNGPDGPLRGSESAKKRGPGRQRRRASSRASGAQICNRRAGGAKYLTLTMGF